MDRYYKILGIPDNSLKEVIKKAYHEKMKALHPDNVDEIQWMLNPYLSDNVKHSMNKHNISTQLFATVTSCDWLNVRSNPSSVNNNNIIEAIFKNTRVEILERNNNGWVKIKYNNCKLDIFTGVI